MTTSPSLRIDRWLFFCRFYKKRVLASAAVNGGHVKLNGERPTSAAKVKVGDRIELIRDRLPYTFAVESIPLRRGPAAEAKACYLEDDNVIKERAELSAALSRDRLSMPRTQGRPDKHTRRQLRSRNRDG